MKDGILNINKPQEMTSFDVVAILRKKLGIKRIGHLGTLDPMAEGVLPVAVGKATRVMEYLGSDMKEYIGEFVFGISTDTDDIWGEVLYVDENIVVTRTDLENCIKSFIGEVEQVPPKYSALKVAGRKLYDYARAGQDVEIKSRKIYIESIDIIHEGVKKIEKVNMILPSFTLKIRCGKGTYIRSIARDMGSCLGTFGSMSGLVRTKNGAFKIEDAISIEDIRHLEITEIEALIRDVDYALDTFSSVRIGEWETHLFRNGVKLEPNQWKKDSDSKEELSGYSGIYRVYGNIGFIGLGKENEKGQLKAEKVLI